MWVLTPKAEATVPAPKRSWPSGPGTHPPAHPREREIATLVSQGLTNRQIAATARISERTAENHVQHILTKLGFTTRAQIAAWVARTETGRPP